MGALNFRARLSAKEISGFQVRLKNQEQQDKANALLNNITISKEFNSMYLEHRRN